MSRSSLLFAASLVAGCALAGASALAASSAKNPAEALAKGEAGRIYFRSATAWSPRDLVTGNYTKKEVVWGDLALPQTDAAKAPTVVIMHGSTGVLDEHKWTAAQLNKAGYATMIVYSYEARGIKSAVRDQSAVTTATTLKDVYEALKLLATHPDIDAKRIALAGTSKGGMVAFWAGFEPLRKALSSGDLKFAAHDVLYGACIIQFKNPLMTGAPMLFQLGKLDTWDPPQGCSAYAEKMRKAGHPAKVIVYDDAYHGWWPGISRFEVATFGECLFHLDDNAVAYDAPTGRNVQDKVKFQEAARRCIKRKTVTVGAKGTSVRETGLEDLVAFLKEAMKP
jgi:dienelactone hydrolase